LIWFEKTEPLARWAANDDIGGGNFRCRIVEDVHNVACNAVVPKVPAVRTDAICVEIVRPYGIERMPEHLGEPESHPTSTSEYVDQAEPLALPGE
jgi:hypothetical protein